MIPICSNDTALNCDVSQDGQHLGRLYVFPTTNPDLIVMGIEKEWFLAHSEGEFVISGHVNCEGQWSLSPVQSLQPTAETLRWAKSSQGQLGKNIMTWNSESLANLNCTKVPAQQSLVAREKVK